MATVTIFAKTIWMLMVWDRFTWVNGTTSAAVPERPWLLGTMGIVPVMFWTVKRPLARLVLYTVRESVVNSWNTGPGNWRRTRMPLVVDSGLDDTRAAASPATVRVELYESTT